MSSPDAPTEPLPPPQEPPRRLTRSSTDRVLGGVAGGLGRYFGVDPILFRIGFAVLTLAGGTGALAYIGLWLLVPQDTGQRVSPNRAAAVIGAAVLAIALFGLIPGGGDWWFFPPGLFGLAVLVGVAVLIYQSAQGELPRTALSRAVLVAGAFLGAAALGIGAAIAAALGGGIAVAIVVIALGVALVASAFTRGRRWLLLPALALAAPLAFVAAADLEIDGGFGERDYAPATIADVRDRYQLGAGEMWIDLRDVDFPPGETRIDLELGAGEINVLVPPEVCVSTDTRVGIGVVEWFDEEDGGVDVDVSRSAAEPGRPELRIVGDIDLGALRVDYEADRDFGRRWHRGDRFDEDAPTRQRCGEIA